MPPVLSGLRVTSLFRAAERALVQRSILDGLRND
jgi:hypothetical protein